jgi:hypothetical protein
MSLCSGLRAGFRAPAGLDVFDFRRIFVCYSLHARPGFETPLSSYGEWAIRYMLLYGFAKREIKVLDIRGFGIASTE